MEDERTSDLFGFKFKKKDNEEQQGKRDTHFNQFMFGRSRDQEVKDTSEQTVESDAPLNKYLGQIDLDEVMYHVDTLITSARELKPLVGKVKPLLDYFIEKNKS